MLYDFCIIGGGIVGTNAAKIAAGFGAKVTILDSNLYRLRYLDDVMPKNVVTMMSNHYNILKSIRKADMVIGAVLIPGARAPHLVTRDMLKEMKPGSVIIDVSVDQGGCVETCKPTTHENPTYVIDGVVHYCVANMPGAVPRTSTLALTNVTFPHALRIADLGVREALTNAVRHAAASEIVNAVAPEFVEERREFLEREARRAARGWRFWRR